MYTKTEHLCIRCSEKYLGGSGSKHCPTCSDESRKQAQQARRTRKRAALRMAASS